MTGGDAVERLAAQVGFVLEVDRLKVRALWDEFESAGTPEARFARSLDRFAGFLLNHASAGASWRENGITAARVFARNQEIDAGAPALWGEVRRRLAEAVAEGWILPGDPATAG